MTDRSIGSTLAGALLAVGAAALWGATGTIQSLLPEGSDSLVVGAARLAIGAAGLVAFAALVARRSGGAGVRRLSAAPVLAAGVFIALYNLLFFAGVARAGVGLGTALAIGSGPIWVGLWELVVLRARPSAARLAAQGLAIAGVLLLALSGDPATGDAAGRVGLGMALSLAAGAAYAAYTLATEAAGDGAPAPTLAAATFVVAAIVAAPAFALGPTAWMLSAEALALLAFLGLGATALAYALYTAALRLIAASSAVTYALAEPLTAWLLATLVLLEPTGPVKAIGAGLLFAGLIALSRTPAPAPEPRPARR